MPCGILALAVVLALPANTVVVAPGETLGQIAARELGDEEAGPEIALVNHLGPDAHPAKGTKLLLPGPERAVALEKIHAVQSAMRGADSEEGRKAAQHELGRAFEALHAARYDEAASIAASASEELASPTTRVSVIVEPAAKETRFLVETGSVEVSSAGASAVGGAGSTVKARAGSPPAVTRDAAPPPPALLEPADGALVAEAALHWSGVPAAAHYRVIVARDRRFRQPVFSADVDGGAAVAPLQEGVWFWRVQAVGAAGGEGVPAVARSFTLKREHPSVNVGTPVFGK